MIIRKKCSAVQAAQASVGGGVISLSSESYNIGSSISSGSSINPIGRPIFCLNGEGLESNEIWLEGQEVSKTEFPLLYDVYGDTYGTPTNSNNFVLPNFKNRTLWGSEDGTFGYIEAGLPNITGGINIRDGQPNSMSGAFKDSYATSGRGYWDRGDGQTNIRFNASKSNPIYSDDVTTVQPPSVKVRVKTRFK